MYVLNSRVVWFFLNENVNTLAWSSKLMLEEGCEGLFAHFWEELSASSSTELHFLSALK